MEPPSFHRLSSADDPLMPAARRLFLDVFPEEGEGGWDWILGGMRGTRGGATAGYSLILYCEERPLGLAAVAFWPDAGAGTASLAYLDYLGVREGARDGGIGARLYRRALDEARRSAASSLPLMGMAFDVECPQFAEDDAERGLRLRRIGFYRRQGAREMPGVLMLEPPEGDEPAIPGCLLYHPLAEEPPAEDLLILLYRLLFGFDENDPLVVAARAGRLPA